MCVKDLSEVERDFRTVIICQRHNRSRQEMADAKAKEAGLIEAEETPLEGGCGDFKVGRDA